MRGRVHMRLRARVDANHKEIIMALRAIGASVVSTHQLGKGFPDALVMFRGRLYLIEIKDGSKPPSARKLTEQEQRFALVWSECTRTVTSIDEAYKVIGAI
jgi:hypothetical protein